MILELMFVRVVTGRGQERPLQRPGRGGDRKRDSSTERGLAEVGEEKGERQTETGTRRKRTTRAQRLLHNYNDYGGDVPGLPFPLKTIKNLPGMQTAVWALRTESQSQERPGTGEPCGTSRPDTLYQLPQATAPPSSTITPPYPRRTFRFLGGFLRVSSPKIHSIFPWHR